MSETEDDDRRSCILCSHKINHEHEMIVQGALMCCVCFEIVNDIIEADRRQRAEATPPSDSTSLGELVTATTQGAHDVAAAEERGEMVSLVTPLGGTVKDPLELKLYAELKAENISMCPSCYNKGWYIGLTARPSTVVCGCPYGRFYEAKTGSKAV